MDGQSTEQAGVVLRKIGVGADGTDLYAYADRSPIVQPAPLPAARPWGAYIALGTLAVGGITAVAFAAAILAIALSIGMVSATVCLMVLKSMWQQVQQDRKK